MFMKNIASWFVLISVVLFAACEDGDLNESPVTFGIRHDKTLNEYEAVASNTGEFSSTDYPDFSSVLAFSYSLDGSSSGEFVATGVLITPKWILTAGHNFYVAEEQSEPALVSGITVFSGNNPNTPDAQYEVVNVIYHPTWVSENEDFLKANDLCLVELAEPILDIVPAKVYTENDEPLDQTTWFAGFGDYTNNPNGMSLSKKHAVENILDRKVSGIQSGSEPNLYSGGLLAFDFDSPLGDFNSLGDDIVNSDEAILGGGNSSPDAVEFEGATVPGDSGGPLFMNIDGSWQVVGILSGGANEPYSGHETSDYGDISVYIRVSQNIQWINDIVE